MEPNPHPLALPPFLPAAPRPVSSLHDLLIIFGGVESRLPSVLQGVLLVLVSWVELERSAARGSWERSWGSSEVLVVAQPLPRIALWVEKGRDEYTHMR